MRRLDRTEQIINEDPRVKVSVMFGRGKFQNGVLVEPAADFALDPSDMAQVEAFRNKIWPTIERVNAYAPQHSRIFKEVRVQSAYCISPLTDSL